jgi:hypothetical protein
VRKLTHRSVCATQQQSSFSKRDGSGDWSYLGELFDRWHFAHVGKWLSAHHYHANVRYVLTHAIVWRKKKGGRREAAGGALDAKTRLAFRGAALYIYRTRAVAAGASEQGLRSGRRAHRLTQYRIQLQSQLSVPVGGRSSRAPGAAMQRGRAAPRQSRSNKLLSISNNFARRDACTVEN